MEFLKIVSRRSFLSDALYTALNIGLAIALLVIIRTTDSLLLAFGLVILSKWRVLAVRPRYWFVNMQANLVSLIVSTSFVVFLYVINTATIDSSEALVSQILLTVLYTAWLLLLKPQSKRRYVVAQAGVALFVGVTAVYSIGFNWPASVIVILMWLMGYGTARHVLTNYDESHVIFLSLLWGLSLAEIGWVAYHWTIAYMLPVFQGLLLPQISIIILCFSFLSYKSYDSYFHHQHIRRNDVIVPLVFTIAIIGVLILAFNGVSTSSM